MSEHNAMSKARWGIKKSDPEWFHVFHDGTIVGGLLTNKKGTFIRRMGKVWRGVKPPSHIG